MNKDHIHNFIHPYSCHTPKRNTCRNIQHRRSAAHLHRCGRTPPLNLRGTRAAMRVKRLCCRSVRCHSSLWGNLQKGWEASPESPLHHLQFVHQDHETSRGHLCHPLEYKCLRSRNKNVLFVSGSNRRIWDKQVNLSVLPPICKTAILRVIYLELWILNEIVRICTCVAHNGQYVLAVIARTITVGVLYTRLQALSWFCHSLVV